MDPDLRPAGSSASAPAPSRSVSPSTSPCRGKGYGTEAVRLLVAWLFSDAGATQYALQETVPDNAAMRTVAERLGFEADGTIRYEGQEFVFYVLTRERWVDGRTG